MLPHPELLHRLRVQPWEPPGAHSKGVQSERQAQSESVVRAELLALSTFLAPEALKSKTRSDLLRGLTGALSHPRKHRLLSREVFLCWGILELAAESCSPGGWRHPPADRGRPSSLQWPVPESSILLEAGVSFQKLNLGEETSYPIIVLAPCYLRKCASLPRPGVHSRSRLPGLPLHHSFSCHMPVTGSLSGAHPSPPPWHWPCYLPSLP